MKKPKSIVVDLLDSILRAVSDNNKLRVENLRLKEKVERQHLMIHILKRKVYVEK